MVIRSVHGNITAFANIITEYQRNEVAVDLMRRRRDAENGIMDFLFTVLFLWAKENEFDSFSLGLSALAGVGLTEDASTPERALNYIYDHINSFYNFKGLHAFKKKFRPLWEPRYLIYPGTASLPGALTALVRADSGDDFWRTLFKGAICPEKVIPNHLQETVSKIGDK